MPFEQAVKQLPAYALVLRMVLPSLDKVAIKSMEHKTRLQQIHLGLELNQYFRKKGKYPEKLEDLKVDDSNLLKDPFGSGNFKYEATEKGYRITSPGDEEKEIVFSNIPPDIEPYKDPKGKK